MSSERKLVSLASITSQELSWLWPDRIPIGAVTVLEGDPGQGKSLVTYDLAARITTGRPLPETSAAIEPAGVILLQAEDALDTKVRPILTALRAEIDKVTVYDKRQFDQKPLLLPDDLSLLEQAAKQIKAKLVVIDPLASFLNFSASNEQKIRHVTAKLHEFAERQQLAVLLVRHLTKERKNVLTQGAGSVGLIAVARSALLVAPEPGSKDLHRHVLVSVKSNLASAPALAYRTVLKDAQLQVEWLGISPHTALDLATRSQEDPSQVEDAQFFLLQMLAGGPQTSKTVYAKAREAGIAKRTLDRAKKALKVRSWKKGSGKGSYWEWQLADPMNLPQALKERLAAEVWERALAADDVPAIAEAPELPDGYSAEVEDDEDDDRSW